MAAQQAYRTGIRSNRAPEFQAPSVRVTRTGGSAQESTTPILVTAAKMAAVVLVVIAALAFARIALTSATVSTMIESDTLSANIQDARSTGVALEMEQSVLSNPYAISATAKKLDMSTPWTIETIALAPDVVAVNANGGLSLSGTVNNFVEIQG